MTHEFDEKDIFVKMSDWRRVERGQFMAGAYCLSMNKE